MAVAGVVRHEHAPRRARRTIFAIRRALGFEMPQDGRLLEGFVCFLERSRAERITTELALEVGAHAGARAPVTPGASGSRSCAGSRAIWQTIDPASEVPSKDLLPGHRPRIAPYLYTHAEITALMRRRARAKASVARRAS